MPADICRLCAGDCAEPLLTIDMWSEILTAVALFLVLEGLFPFLNPDGFKRSLAQITQFPDTVLRGVGLVSMVLGVLILYVVH